MNFNPQVPQLPKLVKSALIVALALVSLLGLKFIFPEFDWVQTQSVILMAIAAWLVNLVKESTGN